VELELPISHMDEQGHDSFSSSILHFFETPPLGGVRNFEFLNGFSCSTCGERVRWKTLNPEASVDKLLFRATTQCKFNNVQPFSTTISVPSGKLIFNDSLHRNGFEQPSRKGLPDYNSAYGRMKYSQVCESLGLAYGAAIDISPTVLLNETTGDLLIGRLDLDPETEESIVPEGTRVLGEITTDLWAYSFMDYEAYLAAGGKLDDSLTVANVEPGVYTFTHYADSVDYDDEAPGFTLVADAVYSPLS